MNTLKVKISRNDTVLSYPIIVGSDFKVTLHKLLKKQPAKTSFVIITDSVVCKLYGLPLQKFLRQKGLRAEMISFPAGEKFKNQATVTKLQHELLKKNCGRDTLIIALGGGVVGDVAGYVAATYLRGVPYIQVPTTLLAMVDSSIGGKTGIDTPFGKNLIGAFWQPSAVIMDAELIRNLPAKQFISGLLEAVKTFITSDLAAIKLVSQLNLEYPHKTRETLEKIIIRSVQIKAGVVSRDERESNERRIINFGHTIGHSLEQLSNYKIPHGIAVGYGMIAEAKIAELLGILPSPEFKKLTMLLSRFGIDAKEFKKYQVKKIVAVTYNDKKVRGGKPYYVLLKKVGEVYKKDGQFAHPVKDLIVEKALSVISNPDRRSGRG